MTGAAAHAPDHQLEHNGMHFQSPQLKIFFQSPQMNNVQFQSPQLIKKNVQFQSKKKNFLKRAAFACDSLTICLQLMPFCLLSTNPTTTFVIWSITTFYVDSVAQHPYFFP